MTKQTETTQAAAPTFTYAECGAGFARNATSRSRLLAELGEHLKLATTPAEWDAARAEFCTGAKSAGYAAPADLWERTIAAGRDAGLIGDKPVSVTPEATKKAAQRAKAKATEKAKTVAELKADLEAAAAKGDFIAAGKAQKAIEAATKAADRAAIDAAKDATKTAREQITASITAMLKAGDKSGITALAKCAGLLAAGQHAKVIAALKPLKVPAPAK